MTTMGNAEKAVLTGTGTTISASAIAAASTGQDTNALLLDAQLCELITSLRALVRSNEELRAALVDSPGDRDFLIAIAENDDLIGRKREQAADLVRRLRKANVDADLPEDVYVMEVNERGSGGSGGGGTDGTTAADGGGTGGSSEPSAEEAADNDDNDGLFL